mmetsp:Transcript_28801/g.77951  ORF Transcript_28801/g.77951 Transcript_28801/m.77951 type:complete len:250 (-) Transcript_28801:72-821(-)
MAAEAALGRMAILQKDLGTKKTFVAACRELAGLCERVEELPEGARGALGEAGKFAFRVLQTRFSNPKFWQAGLDFFLALDFHLPELEGPAAWRDAAMEEVDEEARERAREHAQRRKVVEDKMHNKGRFSDANTPVTMNELLAASGMIAVDGDDDSRPGMSRDARSELRVVTVVEEDICVVCQEAMPAGSKAKAMPCGHKFHDECLLSWVKKSNSCPTCRFDEMPSEKRHFDDVQRQVLVGGGQRSGLYS